MSVETYNPNEVAKVKHLIALAESIAEKFGGGTGETVTVDTRPTPTLSASGMPTLAQINNNQVPGSYPAITYNGDGVTYVYRKSGCTLVEFAMVSNTNFAMRKMNEFSGQDATGGVYVVGATGTDNYKPIEVEYTLE